MSKKSFYIVIFHVLRLPYLFLRMWSASYLKVSGVAHITIIFIIRIISASIVNYFLINIANFPFMVQSRN
jgi:hypothetical protein